MIGNMSRVIKENLEMLRKVIGLLLVLTLILGMLTGCGGSKNSSSEGIKTGTDSALSNNDNKSDSSDKPTFKITTVRWSDWGEDFLKGFIESTEEEAGIDVKWDIILNADWGDKKAVIMASGDLPDAFWGSNCFDDGALSANKGYFIPLDEYITEDIMPNLVKAMKEDPTMGAICTDVDGHIYGLPKKQPVRPTVSNQMFINKKWLDNLNLEMPTTVDEFYNVLKAFKEQDANGNGDPNDEIPFEEGYTDAITAFLLPYGVVDKDGLSAASFKVVNGKPVFNPITEEYKEGIKFMHKCFHEGLIDNEIFTQDGSMKNAKLQNAEIAIVGVSSGWTQDAVFGPHADEYVAMDALLGPYGERYVFSGQDGYQYERREFLITTKCKDPETLLRWADKFYTKDASIQTLYGSFGVGVEKKEDGTYLVLDPPEGESADTFAWMNSVRDFGPKYVPDGFNEKVSFESTTSGDGLKLELSKVVEYAAKPEMAFPSVIFTDEQLNQLSLLGTDIGSYVTTMRAKWISEGGIENEWDSYIEELKRMGLESYLQIHEDGYNLYMSAMK